MKFCIKCNGPVYDDHPDCTSCQKKDMPPVVAEPIPKPPEPKKSRKAKGR